MRLVNQALDAVRRRVQQATFGHRGRKLEPLYRIGRRLLAAHERLDEQAWSRVVALLELADPEGEVGGAYMAKLLLREVYGTDALGEARHRLRHFYEHCAASDVVELDRLARTNPALGTPDPRLAHDPADQRPHRSREPVGEEDPGAEMGPPLGQNRSLRSKAEPKSESKKIQMPTRSAGCSFA